MRPRVQLRKPKLEDVARGRDDAPLLALDEVRRAARSALGVPRRLSLAHGHPHRAVRHPAHAVKLALIHTVGDTHPVLERWRILGGVGHAALALPRNSGTHR